MPNAKHLMRRLKGRETSAAASSRAVDSEARTPAGGSIVGVSAEARRGRADRRLWSRLPADRPLRRLRPRPWSARRIVNGIRKHSSAALLDGLAVALAHQAAALVRFDGSVPPDVVTYFVPSLPFVVAIYIGAYLANGVYWRAWQYAGLMDAVALARATLLGLAIVLVADIAVGMPLQKRPVPLSVALAGGAFSLLATGGVKLAPRLRRRLGQARGGSQEERLLIVGAGEAGQSLVRELRSAASHSYLPVCFVDDNPAKAYLRVHGVPIVGTREDIPTLVEQLGIDVVAVAVPSASGSTVREIVSVCQRTSAKVRIVPGVSEILDGQGGGRPLRDITVEDLLGREPVRIALHECSAYIEGKSVLITGAAGSIGSELARQVLLLEPRRLILLDSNESGLHDLVLRLQHTAAGERVHAAVCSVDRAEAVERIFITHRPQLVFHAAAYKHVPLMEQYPDQAVLVNVVGTMNVCLAAERNGVERFVLISTDKAVHPVNVMGASKRICEELVRSLRQTRFSHSSSLSSTTRNQNSSFTAFCAVRFGNVLDSRGSVIPTFAWQIEHGGPVTVTHPEMRRYFMTIPEAASLVIQAGAYARDGDLFLLDMGEEMSITDLAEKMILLRGLRPGLDIQIAFTGLRPGEKLREELVEHDEQLQPTAHQKINRVDSHGAIGRTELLSRIEELADIAATGEHGVLRKRLFALAEACDYEGQRVIGDSARLPA